MIESGPEEAACVTTEGPRASAEGHSMNESGPGGAGLRNHGGPLEHPQKDTP